jgi:hypothetical protein
MLPKLFSSSGGTIASKIPNLARQYRADGFLVESQAPPLETGAEPIVVLVPVPRGAPPRVVGPGRREREYLARVAGLESALEAAALVERGSSRRLDRMERKLDAVREVVEIQERKEKRLILALGALQRENELLREKLALALPAPKRSLLARLFHRA